MMKNRTVYLDALLGHKVFDPQGKCAGRIEEFVAHHKAGQWVVGEFLLGSEGFFQRLSIAHFASRMLGAAGAIGHRASYRAPWDQIDLSDPTHPRLRCQASELKRIESRSDKSS